MLEMTDSAKSALQRVVEQSQGEAAGVRISLVSGTCADLTFKLELEPAKSEAKDGIDCSGIPLFIDADTGALIKGTRVDYVESLNGGTFTFQNPQASQTCVCGRSFTLATEA